MLKYIAGGALLLSTVAASAADLPSRTKAPILAAAPIAYNWTGFYAGVNAGYGWGKTKDGVKLDPAGVLGGVQVGYNHQINSFVLGLEADFAVADLKDDVVASSNKTEVKVRNLGTVRARAGYVIDNVLLYATGGYAFGNVKLSDTALSSSKTLSGWTLGAGVEYAFTRQITAKVEYLHVDLGNKTFFSGNDAVKLSTRAEIVRVGVNYRF